jgi:hypothetical protein
MSGEAYVNDWRTTLTADPGSGGNTLAVADTAPVELRGKLTVFRVCDTDGVSNVEFIRALVPLDGSSPFTLASRAWESPSRFPAIAHAVGSLVIPVLSQGVLDGRTFVPYFSPEMAGYLTANYDLGSWGSQTNGQVPDGQAFSVRVPAPHPMTVSNVVFRVHTGGSSITTFRVSLHGSDGILIARSANLNTAVTSSGTRVIAPLIPESGKSLVQVGGSTKADFLRVMYQTIGGIGPTLMFSAGADVAAQDSEFTGLGHRVLQYVTTSDPCTDLTAAGLTPDGNGRFFWTALT